MHSVYTNKKSWWLASLISLIIISYTAFFCTPIYNNKEDVYVLYLLAGGFGDSPTYLLHFNHLVHPVIGSVLCFLFRQMPDFNWYSVALYAAMFISIHVSITIVLKRSTDIIKMVLIILTVLVFGNFFLLSATYSAASIMLTIAGLLFFFDAVIHKEISVAIMVKSITLIVVGSMFRLHTVVPLLILAMPFFLFYWKNYARMLLIYGTALIVTVLSVHMAHRMYYGIKIDGWKQEDAYRQNVFRFYNRAAALDEPLVTDSFYTEYNLVKKGLISDENYLSENVLNTMLSSLKKKKVPDYFRNTDELTWFLINHKLECIVSIFLLGICVIHSTNRKQLFAGLITALLLVGGFAVYGKIPQYAVYGLLTGFFTFAIILIKKPPHKPVSTYYMSGAFLFMAWAFILMFKEGKRHYSQVEEFEAAYSEIQSRRDKLFISTGDFPIASFYVWNVPKQFPLHNYLDSEHFILNIQHGVYSRNNLQGINDPAFINRVLWWGHDMDGVAEYFSKKLGYIVKTTAPLPAFKHGVVRLIEK